MIYNIVMNIIYNIVMIIIDNSYCYIFTVMIFYINHFSLVLFYYLVW